MKPCFVLLGVFGISLWGTHLYYAHVNWTLSGRIALSAMLLFSAMGHFIFRKGMALMIPKRIPYKNTIVFVTGIIEILLALGLFLPEYQLVSAWGLILFLLGVLPANIYAAQKHLDYQQGTYDGKGPKYLYIRIPMQVLFIAWTYFSAILA